LIIPIPSKTCAGHHHPPHSISGAELVTDWASSSRTILGLLPHPCPPFSVQPLQLQARSGPDGNSEGFVTYRCEQQSDARPGCCIYQYRPNNAVHVTCLL
jgi:hypothetical protein